MGGAQSGAAVPSCGEEPVEVMWASSLDVFPKAFSRWTNSHIITNRAPA